MGPPRMGEQLILGKPGSQVVQLVMHAMRKALQRRAFSLNKAKFHALAIGNYKFWLQNFNHSEF